MEKFGFIYVWFDRKHHMFYVGSHWGTEKDGYICSSNRMRDAHRRRPTDFRRRIIARIYTDRKDLLIEEQRWLDMIPDRQLGQRYYNVRKYAGNQWWLNDGKSTRQRISESISQKWAEDPDYRDRVSKNSAQARIEMWQSERGEELRQAKSTKSKEMWSRPGFKEKNVIPGQKMKEWMKTEKGIDLLHRLHTDPGIRDKHKEAMNRPEVKAKATAVLLNHIETDEQKMIRFAAISESKRLKRMEWVRDHIKTFDNPQQMCIECGLQPNKVGRAFGVKRWRAEHILEYFDLDPVVRQGNYK